jgi:predicted ester cyclase
MHSTFAELEIHVEELIAGEEKVVARWRQNCLHVGRLLGVSATGKPIEWSGITIFRLQDGKVMDERGEENMLGVMWQLEVIPRPGRKAA